MTLLVKGKKHHRRVVFKRRAMAGSDGSSSSSIYDRFLPRQSGVVTEDSSPQGETEDYISSSSRTPVMSAKVAAASLIPDLFTSKPPIYDLLQTETSRVQEQ